MRGKRGAVMACFWVLKNMPLFELYFSGCPVLGIVVGMGIVAAVLHSEHPREHVRNLTLRNENGRRVTGVQMPQRRG